VAALIRGIVDAPTGVEARRKNRLIFAQLSPYLATPARRYGGVYGAAPM